jgi:predicted nucleotidyltransferase
MIKIPVSTKKEILALIQANQKRIKTFGVKKLGLFGSFMRNKQHSESDIDLLVEFEPGQKSFDNFIQLSFLLEDILQRPVELVTIESLSPYIAPYITEEVEYVISA